MRYFNMKTNYGTETVDELSPGDFKTDREFRKELTRLKNEYILAGMPVYISQRADKSWE